MDLEPNPEEQPKSLEDVSPSLKGGLRKPKEPKKTDKAKDAAKKAGGDAVKKGARQLAKQAALAVGRAIASAVTSAVAAAAAAVGWPVLVGCLVIFLIVMMIFGGLACTSIQGFFGKTLVNQAGKNDPNVKALLAATSQTAKGETHKLDFANPRDREFLESGQIDIRLAAALNYLVQKHEHIRISHIVSAYEDMKANPESGSFHDTQISKNISAHQNGLAADIDEIDYVKETCDCGDPIPVKAEWQTIGENPYGEAPDALNQIKSAEDITKPDVQAALEKLGVTGLDQTDITAKIQSNPILASVEDVYSLTNPNIIAAFESIGVLGLDNSQLQMGLKRIQALQSLNDLDIADLSALRRADVQSIFNEIGVPIGDDTIASIEKYQAAQVLQSVHSLTDLQKQEVKDALQKLGINPDDLNFQNAFKDISAAGSIISWDGADINNRQLTDSLNQLGLTADSQTQQALTIYKSAKDLFEGVTGEITSEAQLIQNLEQLSIDIGSPEAQEAVNKFKAANTIINTTPNFSSSTYLNALQEFNISLTPQSQEFIEKYKAAQSILDYKGGDYSNNPEFMANLNKLGINLTDFQVNVEIPNALQKLVDFNFFVEGNKDEILQNLGKINIDTTDLEVIQQIIAAKGLLSIHSIKDLQQEGMQDTLKTLGLDDPILYQTISQLGGLSSLLSINSIDDLGREDVQMSLKTLGIKNPQIKADLGKIGGLYTLLNIQSPLDLTRPEVVAALHDFNIVDSGIQEQLKAAGSIYSLTQIQKPSDLLKPESLKALNQLGVINLNSEMLGQIGAFQNLLQVNSFQDLLNPSSILSLNTLGIISLSNPVTSGLMIISLVDNLMGGKLLGGLFGGKCKANTACYKPTAQTNVHKAVSELLQFPYNQGSPDNYRVTQLITYSNELDVLPYESQLDKLYGSDRPANYGLFSMPEASTHIHIGY